VETDLNYISALHLGVGKVKGAKSPSHIPQALQLQVCSSSLILC